VKIIFPAGVLVAICSYRLTKSIANERKVKCAQQMRDRPSQPIEFQHRDNIYMSAMSVSH
jgi:hypothetical protein